MSAAFQYIYHENDRATKLLFLFLLIYMICMSIPLLVLEVGYDPTTSRVVRILEDSNEDIDNILNPKSSKNSTPRNQLNREGTMTSKKKGGNDTPRSTQSKTKPKPPLKRAASNLKANAKKAKTGKEGGIRDKHQGDAGNESDYVVENTTVIPTEGSLVAGCSPIIPEGSAILGEDTSFAAAAADSPTILRPEQDGDNDAAEEAENDVHAEETQNDIHDEETQNGIADEKNSQEVDQSMATPEAENNQSRIENDQTQEYMQESTFMETQSNVDFDTQNQNADGVDLQNEHDDGDVEDNDVDDAAGDKTVVNETFDQSVVSETKTDDKSDVAQNEKSDEFEGKQSVVDATNSELNLSRFTEHFTPEDSNSTVNQTGDNTRPHIEPHIANPFPEGNTEYLTGESDISKTLGDYWTDTDKEASMLHRSVRKRSLNESTVDSIKLSKGSLDIDANNAPAVDAINAEVTQTDIEKTVSETAEISRDEKDVTAAETPTVAPVKADDGEQTNKEAGSASAEPPKDAQDMTQNNTSTADVDVTQGSGVDQGSVLAEQPKEGNTETNTPIVNISQSDSERAVSQVSQPSTHDKHTPNTGNTPTNNVLVTDGSEQPGIKKIDSKIVETPKENTSLIESNPPIVDNQSDKIKQSEAETTASLKSDVSNGNNEIHVVQQVIETRNPEHVNSDVIDGAEQSKEKRANVSQIASVNDDQDDINETLSPKSQVKTIISPKDQELDRSSSRPRRSRTNSKTSVEIEGRKSSNSNSNNTNWGHSRNDNIDGNDKDNSITENKNKSVNDEKMENEENIHDKSVTEVITDNSEMKRQKTKIRRRSKQDLNTSTGRKSENTPISSFGSHDKTETLEMNRSKTELVDENLSRNQSRTSNASKRQRAFSRSDANELDVTGKMDAMKLDLTQGEFVPNSPDYQNTTENEDNVSLFERTQTQLDMSLGSKKTPRNSPRKAKKTRKKSINSVSPRKQSTCTSPTKISPLQVALANSPYIPTPSPMKRRNSNLEKSLSLSRSRTNLQ